MPAASKPSSESLVASYRQLAEIYHDLLSREELDQVLDRLVKTVQRLVPVADLLIAEADTVRRILRPLVAEGTWPDGFLGSELPFGEGLIGMTAERGRPVLCNEAHLDPRAGHVAGTPVGEPEAIICVPLVARGVVIGAMSLYRDGDNAHFAEVDFELAQRFADAATLAIENARTRQELRELTRRDELTGLYNRRGFNEHFARAVAAADAGLGPVALIVVDLDDFKTINDRYGHPCGDELLRQVATRLIGAARSSDVVCRLGGDEFVIVLTGSRLEAESVASRIAESLCSGAYQAGGQRIEQRASVGVAIGDDATLRDPEQLLRAADSGMYAEKRRGGDVVALKLVADSQ